MQTPIAPTDTETRLANKVFMLVTNGRHQEANALLRDQGFTDAEYQVSLITGFIRHLEHPIVIRW
jgi:hypothetical protein